MFCTKNDTCLFSPRSNRIFLPVAESAELDYEEEDGVISIKKASWNLGSSRQENGGRFRVRLVNDSLLNIEAIDAPLASLVSEVLAQTKLNTMVYGKIDGQVTAHISEIPIRDALKFLFRGHQFYHRPSYSALSAPGLHSKEMQAEHQSPRCSTENHSQGEL